MPPRYPRLWLMTDERQGDALWDALATLPAGSGVIFRHYALAAGKRKRLFLRVRQMARRKRLILILAGGPKQARAWRADGYHGRHRGFAYPELLHTAPAHHIREILVAARAGAGLVLLSPVYATRSHPGGRPLGRVRFGLISQRSPRPVVALGGMNRERARHLDALGSYGWAGIDGLTPAGRIRI